MKRLFIIIVAVLLFDVPTMAKGLPYEQYMYVDGYYDENNIDLVYDYDYAYNLYLQDIGKQQPKKETPKKAVKKKKTAKKKKAVKKKKTVKKNKKHRKK